MFARYDSRTSKLSFTSPLGDDFTRDKASRNDFTLTVVATGGFFRGERALEGRDGVDCELVEEACAVS